MRPRIFVFAAAVLFCASLWQLAGAATRLEPVAQKKQERVSPHPGVSPAHPDIKPPDRDRRHRRTRGGIAADRLLRQSRKLGLSNDQIARLKDLAYETRKKMIDLRAGLQKEQLELRHLMQSGTEDMRRIRRQLDLVATKRADVQEARIAHWIASKNVLNKDQRELIKQGHPRLDRFRG